MKPSVTTAAAPRRSTATQHTQGKRRAAIGGGVVAVLLLGAAAVMMKPSVTSAHELSTKHFIQAEALLADTFQPRKLESLSDECKLALKDQKKTQLKKAIDLAIEEEYVCDNQGKGSLDCKKIEKQIETFNEDLEAECRVNG